MAVGAGAAFWKEFRCTACTRRFGSRDRARKCSFFGPSTISCVLPIERKVLVMRLRNLAKTEALSVSVSPPRIKNPTFEGDSSPLSLQTFWNRSKFPTVSDRDDNVCSPIGFHLDSKLQSRHLNVSLKSFAGTADKCEIQPEEKKNEFFTGS